MRPAFLFPAVLALPARAAAAEPIDRPLGKPIEQFSSGAGQSQLANLQTSGRAGTPPPYFEATGRWYEPDAFRELSAKAEWPK